MQTRTVPFIDLPRAHQELGAELAAATTSIIESAAFVGGAPVNAFEKRFSSAIEVPHTVGVKSGTAALHLGLQSLGVRPGDEVILPAFTFIATAAPVALLGAVPVFVDVEPDTACIDPAQVRKALTAKTKVIVPVHLYGHPANMDPLIDTAKKHGASILEDCAQSHLATFGNAVTGGLGDVGAFSFYPTKNLGAAGDAGACTTHSPTHAERIRSLANHGRSSHQTHEHLGWNERLDAIQAAILTVKLKYLERWTRERREAAARYDQLLKGASPLGHPLRLPTQRSNCRHVYHLYVTRHPKRDDLSHALARAGIASGVYYPQPVPYQPAFGLTGRWPEAEAWADTCLALPLYPGIPEEDQARVAEVIRGLN